SLGLANTNPPGFLQSPGQVGFSPDGSRLVITLKGNAGGAVDVFNVSDDGQLSTAPTATAVGGVAFAFVFDSEGRLVIVNAAFGNVSTFNVNSNGSLLLVSAGASSGQLGACWVAEADGNFYTGNTGSANLSQFAIDDNGTVALRNPQAATGVSGAIDMAVSG